MQCCVIGKRTINSASTQLSAISTCCHRSATANRQPRFAARAGPPDIDISSLLDDLDLPQIDADLASFQAEGGAVFDVSLIKNIIPSFLFPIFFNTM